MSRKGYCIDSVWNETNTDDVPAFLQEITKLSSYEIISIEEGDTCIINVIVKGIDVGSQLNNLSYEDFPQTEEALNDYLLDIIKNSEVVETTAVVYAERLDDGYRVFFSETFVDAMSGKIYSYYMSLLEEVLGK